MSSSNSIFISRLRGLRVVDAGGDMIGKVRDVVVQVRTGGRPPRAKGLVVELFARQRIFVNMARVHSIDGVQVAIEGVVNTRRFRRHEAETLVVDDLFDQVVFWPKAGKDMVVFDIAIAQVRRADWEVTEVALRDRAARRLGRRPHVTIVDWSEATILGSGSPGRETDLKVAEIEDMHAADVARELHDMTPERRRAVIAVLDDEKLADAIGEMPDDDQVELIAELEVERAADVLEEMDPDDATDLINELDAHTAEILLGRMEPEEAQDVRRLMVYDENTAGGLMTPEPVILPPDATVADALAKVREAEVPQALACMVHVTRAPMETPTGRYLGSVHIQRLLREPPSMLVSGLVDAELEALGPQDELQRISRFFATYNLVCAPVVDDQRRLVGAITVDDVLDNMLPDDWRDKQLEEG